MNRNILRRGPYFLLVLVALVIVGCTGGDQGEEPVVTFGSGDPRFPTASIQDIVSYSDQLATFEVISEREIAPPKEVFERGEGYIGRTVTVRIEQEHWNSNRILTDAKEIQLTVQGWALHDGERRLFSFAGVPRLEVGKRYVAPLVFLSGGRFGAGEWALYDSSTALELVDGKPVATRLVEGVKLPEATSLLIEYSLEELGHLFSTTEPDPIAAQFSELDPDSRYSAVVSAKRARGDQ